MPSILFHVQFLRTEWGGGKPLVEVGLQILRNTFEVHGNTRKSE